MREFGMTMEDFLRALRFVNETQKMKGFNIRYGIVPEYHMDFWDDEDEDTY